MRKIFIVLFVWFILLIQILATVDGIKMSRAYHKYGFIIPKNRKDYSYIINNISFTGKVLYRLDDRVGYFVGFESNDLMYSENYEDYLKLYRDSNNIYWLYLYKTNGEIPLIDYRSLKVGDTIKKEFNTDKIIFGNDALLE